MMKIKEKGLQDYNSTWQEMLSFTEKRNNHTEDELWTLEHRSVFTQGLSGKPEHLLKDTEIEVIKSDRGGQITYHGPGQLIVYCLIDIKRLGIGVKQMVSIIEKSIIDLLSDYSISSHKIPGAPGVYVDGSKIAALGLKIKRGKTYHGLSLNVDMNLSPYSLINPCGYKDLKITQMSNLTDNKPDLDKIKKQLTKNLTKYVSRS
ncbi:lipoyl(octanoyl) transferase LipB [Pseudothioglobus sp. nBUS_23]|uniref:lipoyl(octanoyl) transferase LipB n=1 Tax=Pseudothioglobus sp. nBUS_23 TaxID=3395318 RepID=UPI003EBB7826